MNASDHPGAPGGKVPEVGPSDLPIVEVEKMRLVVDPA